MFIYTCNECEVFDRRFVVISLRPFDYDKLVQITLTEFASYDDYDPSDLELDYELIKVPAWPLDRNQIATFKTRGYLFSS